MKKLVIKYLILVLSSNRNTKLSPITKLLRTLIFLSFFRQINLDESSFVETSQNLLCKIVKRKMTEKPNPEVVNASRFSQTNLILLDFQLPHNDSRIFSSLYLHGL